MEKFIDQLKEYRMELMGKSTQELMDEVRLKLTVKSKVMETIRHQLLNERTCLATLQLDDFHKHGNVRLDFEINEVLKVLHCRVEGKPYTELFPGKKKDKGETRGFIAKGF